MNIKEADCAYTLTSNFGWNTIIIIVLTMPELDLFSERENESIFILAIAFDFTIAAENVVFGILVHEEDRLIFWSGCHFLTDGIEAAFISTQLIE